MERQLADALRHFQEAPVESTAVRVARWLTLRFLRASETHATRFVLGSSQDHDGGGFIVAEMARNLQICIEEKSIKVARFLGRYPEWWLVLDDRIGCGVLDESERRDLRDQVPVCAPWSKIVLVNALDPLTGFAL